MLAVIGCEQATPLAAVPAGFSFVRDEADLFDDEEQSWAEERLREIAGRTGVYGVVLTGDAFPDRPVALGPVIEEVAGLGGEALITLCTADECDLTTSSSASAGLQSRVELVAPAPEPAPGGFGGERRLRSWIEFVGAVATMDR